jgi:hypothetical protein
MSVLGQSAHESIAINGKAHKGTIVDNKKARHIKRRIIARAKGATSYKSTPSCDIGCGGSSRQH